MGMYTVFHLDVRLRNDMPDNILHLLEYMLNGSGAYDYTLPNHPLFQTERWDCMLRSSNTYDTCVHQLERQGRCMRLFVQSSFKNYDGEIDKFLDWFTPYVDPVLFDDVEFIGYTKYEEDAYPKLIMYKTDENGEQKLYTQCTLAINTQ